MTRFLFPILLLLACTACSNSSNSSGDSVPATDSQPKADINANGKFTCTVDGADFGFNGKTNHTYSIPRGLINPELVLRFSNDKGNAVWLRITDNDSMKTLPRTQQLSGPDPLFSDAAITWWKQVLKEPFVEKSAAGSTVTITAWDRDARKVSGNFTATVSDNADGNTVVLEGTFTDVIYK